MTTIKEFTDQIEAGILQSFLADNQIDAVLIDENASAWCQARMLIPIRLQVPDDQAEEAYSLIQTFENSPIISDTEEK